MTRRESPASAIRVTLGILLVAALATRVVPVVSSGPTDELRDHALEECGRIRAAVRQFASDTGRLPGHGTGWMHGEGPLPASAGREPALPNSPIRTFLTEGDPRHCGPFWDGPYLMRLGPDPWGRAYVVVRTELGGAPEPALWVLSAGPNGTIDTVLPADGPAGDDVGLPVR